MSIKKDNIFIILYEPKIPENIGFVARLMKNFGFKNLIIVNPLCDLTKAYKTAMKGKDVLENAVVVDQLNFNEFDFIAATSGKVSDKPENLRRSYITPEDFANFIANKNMKIGILFGREDFGLPNSIIKKSNVLIHIETSKEYPILNLSHATGIILYELNKKSITQSNKKTKTYDLKGLYSYIDYFIELFDKYNIKRRSSFDMALKRTLSNILVRSNINYKEFSIFMGFFSKLKNLYDSILTLCNDIKRKRNKECYRE